MNSVLKAVSYLNKYKTVKNTYFGFQQSTWIITGALGFIDSNSDFFNNHLVVISEYMNAIDNTRNIILILESLACVQANIDKVRDIIEDGKNKLLELYEEDEKVGGWKENNNFNAGLTLSGLILLLN